MYCERCGVNCFLVAREAMPSQCELSNMFMPTLHYPCFGTARTAGAYLGHEIDPYGRSPVKLSDDLLVLLVTNSYGIPDISKHLHAVSSDFPHWGCDWCDFIYDTVDWAKGDLYQNYRKLFLSAVDQFRDQNFEEAAILFRQIPLQVKKCNSNHWTEFSCRAISSAKYNAAISLLNSVPGLDDIRSSNYSYTIHTLLSEASQNILSGNGDNRIKMVTDFFGKLLRKEAMFNHYSSTWYSMRQRESANIMLAHVGLTVCSDVSMSADIFCRKYGISDTLCKDLVFKKLKDTYQSEFIEFPSCINDYDVNSYEANAENLIPFQFGKCFQKSVADFTLAKSQFCENVNNVNFLLVTGVVDSITVELTATVIRHFVTELPVFLMDETAIRIVSQLFDDIIAQKRLRNKRNNYIENISRDMLRMYECSQSAVSNHPILCNNNSLSNMAQSLISEDWQSLIMTNVTKDIHNIFMNSLLSRGSDDSILVEGHTTINLAHSLWKQVHPGKNSPLIFFVIPDLKLTLRLMMSELEESQEFVLEKFVVFFMATIRSLSHLNKSEIIIFPMYEEYFLSSNELNNINTVWPLAQENVRSLNLLLSAVNKVITSETKTSIAASLSIEFPPLFSECYNSVQNTRSLDTFQCAQLLAVDL